MTKYNYVHTQWHLWENIVGIADYLRPDWSGLRQLKLIGLSVSSRTGSDDTDLKCILL